MAEAGILRGGVPVAGVMVRILKMEAHNLSSIPTQYAVESGKSIADHVNLQPHIVQIRCEMPNSDGGTEKARNVLLDFNRIREERKPMQLLTEHVSYKNMVLVGIQAVHQAPYKGALVYDLTFHQVGVLGETNLVSAAGGRSPDILAQDGTQATACQYVNAGEIPPITSGATLNACGRKLSGGAA